MQTTPDLGIPELAEAQDLPHVTHNEAIVLMQALLNGAIDKDLTAPPGSPTEGDTYIINTASPTGAWAGHARAVAIFWNGSWRFVPGNDDAGTPIVMGSRQEGLSIWVRDEDTRYTWTGAAWSSLFGIPASSVSFTPTGNISATNVQAAIAEVDSEKVAKAGDTMTGALNVTVANQALRLTQGVSGLGVTDSVAAFESTDAGATGPHLALYHNSASPAASDVIRMRAFFNNTLGTATAVAAIVHTLDSPTAAAESATVGIATRRAGSFVQRLLVANGAYMEGMSDPGIGNFNAAALYENGVSIATKYVDVAGDTMTGNLSLAVAGGATLNLDASAAGQQQAINFNDGGTTRWRMRKNTANEFLISRFNSFGVFQDDPLTINTSGDMAAIGTFNAVGGLLEGGVALSAKYAQLAAANTFTAKQTVNTTGADGITLIRTDDANIGPSFTLIHESTTPAVNDVIAAFSSQARNSAAALLTYASFNVAALNVTAGAEEGRLTFTTAVGGANGARFRIAQGMWSNTSSGDPGIGSINLAGFVRTGQFTVATLPSAATAGAGARAFVTDALGPAFGVTVTGGGGVKVPVYSDGTNWLVG